MLPTSVTDLPHMGLLLCDSGFSHQSDCSCCINLCDVNAELSWVHPITGSDCIKQTGLRRTGTGTGTTAIHRHTEIGRLMNLIGLMTVSFTRAKDS